MASIHQKTLAVATAAYDAWHGPDVDLAGMRAGFDSMLPEPAGDVTVWEDSVNGVPGRWICAPDSGPTTILYVHGGGGALGSSYAYRDLASRLSRAAGARVFVPDYALSPENPYPAGLNDVRKAYAGLLESAEVSAEHLVVAGDSAGAGLALGLTLELRDTGVTLPCCVVAFSPVADWSASGESMQTMAPADDPLVSLEATYQMAAMYLGSHPATDPIASPVFADYSGFPPLLVQVGTAERLLDDARRVAEAARQAGVDVELQIAQGMVHVYQMFAYAIDEAQSAIEAAGAFISAHQPH